ncbi:MAG: flagellar export chaperone FliS [Candidatus Tectimicrobiota bacterium]
MPGHYAYNAYMQAKVQPETDPKRLILMLYEGALEHLALTREGIEECNARKRGEHLSRAVAIISELYTALDPSVTDESIEFLRGLYQSMLVELARVAVTHEVQSVNLACRYLERLKEIWKHDVMGLPVTAATAAPVPAAASAAAPEGAPTPPAAAARPRLRAYGDGLALGQRTFSV